MVRRSSLILAVLLPASLSAQVPTILEQIGQLESVRDPKCYATASRLEDFIYGTPLETEARFEKIALQKELIRALWLAAGDRATAAGRNEIGTDLLEPLVRLSVPYGQEADETWTVFPDTPRRTSITAHDKRQYGSIAYALRAVLAVQQDAYVSGPAMVPLDSAAVALLKETVDLTTLAALQRADRAARQAGSHHISGSMFRSAWRALVPEPKDAIPAPPASAPSSERFATIRGIIEAKLSAFEKYNSLSLPVFLRNVQVYMARHLWPDDPEAGKLFKDRFNETMIAWTSDVLLEAEKRARASKHGLIRVEHVHDAVQLYQPHELNAYEDCIYFPRLPKDERIVIEAYDLDSFRDPGLHWFYLKEALNDPAFEGTIEPDPFAAELLTEGVAQMGTLLLRVAGFIARDDGRERLHPDDLPKAALRIQKLLDRHASMPAPRKGAARVASAPDSGRKTAGTYFTDVTAASGIAFEHRTSDWLSRFIRGYTVVDGDKVRLAVPPAFGGSGAAAEDIDDDGDTDAILLGGAGNALYLNDGRGRFSDATVASGLAWKRPDGTAGEPRQVIVADFDNDLRQDVLITYVDDDHRLYRNLGGAKFEDVTGRCNLGGAGLVGGPATALDFNRDGLLDLYIGYFGDFLRGELPTLSRRNSNALPNKLFRNRGNFVFEDVTAGSGVDNRGWTQAVGHLDFDSDGWEDLICGNDFGVNAWYRNRGNGTFEDVARTLGTDKPSYTMGIGITDLNRDGHPDVYISNIVTMDKDETYVLPDTKTRMKFNPEKMAHMRVVEANDLFTSVVSGGSLARYDLSDAVGRGYRSTGWSWGAHFLDFDNDGDDDLYVANGMNEYSVYSSVNPYFTDTSGSQRQAFFPVSDKEANVFFVNRDGKLVEESARSGADLLGNSRSVAYLDADSDGDLDMLVNNFQGPAVMYRNNSEKGGRHWIRIRLIGNPEKKVTADAIGARIFVEGMATRGRWREVFSTVGYLTSNPKEQHIGLGSDAKVDLTVVWPNGERQTFRGVEAGGSYSIRQGEAIVRR